MQEDAGILYGSRALEQRHLTAPALVLYHRAPLKEIVPPCIRICFVALGEAPSEANAETAAFKVEFVEVGMYLLEV